PPRSTHLPFLLSPPPQKPPPSKRPPLSPPPQTPPPTLPPVGPANRFPQNRPSLPSHSRLIPHSPLHCRRSHSRDFVPWRFSDAWRHRVWIGSSCRRQRNLHISGREHLQYNALTEDSYSMTSSTRARSARVARSFPVHPSTSAS